MSDFISRFEHIVEVDSTQRVVTEWLTSGTPEVAVAVADVQTAGRGRHGRRWDAPPGAALLCSCGFRPAWLAPRHAWRLPAIAALAMLDAAEEVAGLRDDTLGLKWPNDLVAESPAGDGSLLKLAGVLGETALGPATRGSTAEVGTPTRGSTAVVGTAAGERPGAPTADAPTGERPGAPTADAPTGEPGILHVVVGIGVNVDWAARDFPPGLAGSITSLSEVARRPVDREQLLDAFLARLEPRYEALRAGRFDSGGWSVRQRTTGRLVAVDSAAETLEGLGAGVDPESGALLLEVSGADREIDVGEVTRCRLRG